MSTTFNPDDLYDLYRDLDARLQKERYAELDQESVEKTEDETKYSLSQWQLMWRKYIRNRAALIGGIIIVVFYIVAIFGNFVAPYTLTTRFRDRLYMEPQRIHLFDEGRFSPFVYRSRTELNMETYEQITYTDYDQKDKITLFIKGEPYTMLGFIESDIHLFGVEDSAINILGTEAQGRDMFSRIVKGSQVSLTIGLVGVLLSLLLGTLLGVISGYYGGGVDNFIQRLIELVRAFPSIPLWMALSAAIPPTWPPMRVYFGVTIILSLIGWTWLARQLRGLVLSLRGQDYVVAAKLMGAKDRRLIVRHMIPATTGQIIVVATLSMPTMILAETALSFLGLGLQPPITSWGVLLKEIQNLQSIALYPWVFSTVFFIVLTVLAFNFMGDGLRDAADPYTR